MKRFIKGSFGLLCLTIVVSLLPTISSCETSETNSLTTQTNAFLQFYSNNYENLVTQDISNSPLISSRSSTTTQKSESVVLYADFPQDTKPEIRQLCSEIKTPNDIAAFQHATDVELSYKKTTTSDSIILSKEKAEQAIVPVIIKSKEYLIEKGFNQKEIQEMLAENNSDESQLVTLVMVLQKSNRHKQHKI